MAKKSGILIIDDSWEGIHVTQIDLVDIFGDCLMFGYALNYSSVKSADYDMADIILVEPGHPCFSPSDVNHMDCAKFMKRGMNDGKLVYMTTATSENERIIKHFGGDFSSAYFKPYCTHRMAKDLADDTTLKFPQSLEILL